MSLARRGDKATLPRFGTDGASGYNGRMQITLNGQPHVCAPATTIVQLLEAAGYGGRRVAVELNHEIVPRSQHASRTLAEGDQVEIVQAIGGG
ncbi:sulfur carrier protein ThiS [Rhodanobacter geophilus]|uniref:sulfur carrier protein ThiS n=1 Tax=Rhodanobacter geophilus TaxID=3162488 RepID=UPI003F5BD7AF